jgi:hypothetical protein
MTRQVAKSIAANLAVRQQAEAVSLMHRRLYPWADRIRRLVGEDTGVDVPDVVIGTARLRRSIMGYYVIGRDAFRLRGSVMLNTIYLRLPMCWVLEVLCHEVLHFAEELSGEMSRATHSAYHTAWFRRHAEQIGIPCTREGASVGNELSPSSPFGKLLLQHGIKLLALRGGGDDRPGPHATRVGLPPPRTTQARFTCGCTVIRGARRVQAKCLVCGRVFVATESR